MVASSFDTTLVSAPAGAQALATQLVEAGQGSVLLYNQDPTNSVLLGDDNAVLANDQSGVAPLGPKSSIVFDGSKDVFATVAPGATANVASYPSALQFTQATIITPLAQIGSLTGSPAGTVVPGTPFVAMSLVDVSGYASYDLNAYAFSQSPGSVNANVVMQIQLQWFDDLVSGISVFEEDWWVWVGRAAPTVNTLAGCGPMHGRYMTVNVFPVITATFNLTLQYINIFGSNRTVPYSDWRQNGAQVNPQSNTITEQAGGGDSFDNILASISNETLTASQLVFIPCGLYSGPVYYRFQCNTAAPLHDPTIVNMAGQVSGGLGAGTGTVGVLVNFTQDTLEHEGTLLLPRAPCAFIIQGATSGTSNYSFQLIAQQAA